MTVRTTMRAARYHPRTKAIQVETIPIPEPKDVEILVKTASSSLCHSDLMLLDGSFPGSESEPVTLGHESVGYVERVGSKVSGFKRGDRIGFLFFKEGCFTCRGCMIHNLSCEKGTTLLQGFSCDGFFAEYSTVDYRCAIILPNSLDMRTSSSLFCAGITAFNGVNSCDLKPSEWIAIIGCGGLGQFGIQYAKAMGLKVVGLDINDNVLAAAKDAGADLVYNSLTNDTYVDELNASTGGGVEAATVFSAAHAAYKNAPKILLVGGLIMVVGLPSKPLEFDAVDMMMGRYRVKAETTGPPWKVPRAIEFTAKHGIKANVELYKLDDIQEMIKRMQNGETIKRMAVVFDDERHDA